MLLFQKSVPLQLEQMVISFTVTNKLEELHLGQRSVVISKITYEST